MKYIMILEGDRKLQLAYKELLANYSCHIVVYSDVASAADYLSQNHVDLIISDYNLRDATSMVLLKLMQVWNKETPTVIITENALIKEEHPNLDNLVNSLMFKPIHKWEFHNHISPLLSA